MPALVIPYYTTHIVLFMKLCIYEIWKSSVQCHELSPLQKVCHSGTQDSCMGRVNSQKLPLEESHSSAITV